MRDQCIAASGPGVVTFLTASSRCFVDLHGPGWEQAGTQCSTAQTPPGSKVGYRARGRHQASPIGGPLRRPRWSDTGTGRCDFASTASTLLRPADPHLHVRRRTETLLSALISSNSLRAGNHNVLQRTSYSLSYLILLIRAPQLVGGCIYRKPELSVLLTWASTTQPVTSAYPLGPINSIS